MATLLDSLKAVSAYPIPLRTLDEVATRRGVTLSDEATKEKLQSREYNLAKADLMLWLSFAPNVSQGGQSYSFSEEQRKQLKNDAYALYALYSEEEADKPKVTYGYKGSRL